MSKIFWVDDDKLITYDQLIVDLNKLLYGKTYVWERSTYDIFQCMLLSIINDYPIVLLDGDLTKNEILDYSLNLEKIKQKEKCFNQVDSYEDLISYTKSLKKWRITLFTSGTTGLPKQITHSFTSLTKTVKKSKSHTEDIWGLAYNPTHMAGIQVFWQAFLNKNSLINLFQKNPKQIDELINTYNVTHISATPSFFRMFIEKKKKYPQIKQVTSGGEKLSSCLKKKLIHSFPNAKLKNIYASTEAGSLFASEGEYFKIPERYKDLIKIIDNELLIHKSLIGSSESLHLKNDWFHTGDLVEITKYKTEIIFKFLSRKNETINIGGYKVNPYEVEEELLKIHGILNARVYGRSNSLLGNILCADVVAKNIEEKDIRKKLKLQSFKIPRIINFTDELETTRTGKTIR